MESHSGLACSEALGHGETVSEGERGQKGDTVGKEKVHVASKNEKLVLFYLYFYLFFIDSLLCLTLSPM